MSKSKNNYIGITEPPKVMFRKVMGISDELMWRYWELLTDLSLPEIAALKQREPMGVKMELAERIVADFHSQADAAQAGDDFNREVRQGAEPADIETVPNMVHRRRRPNLPKLLVGTGLAPSRTEAERLLKAGAVEIDGVRCTQLSYSAEALYDPRGEEVEEDRVSLIHDAAVAHLHHPVRVRGGFGVVGDHQDGLAETLVQIPQDPSTASEFSVSRFPVGSSASRSAG